MNTISFYLYELSEKIAAVISLTFLGTGPSGPIYEKRGKSRRLNSSALIKYRNKSYLIDIGPTFDEKIMFDYLLITHLHKDAFGGIKFVKDRKFTFIVPERLSENIDFKPSWNKENIKINHKNKIKNLNIIPFPIKHDIVRPKFFPTYGYQFIFDDGKKLTYASDMIGIPEGSEKYFNNIDILVADGAGWKSNLSTHFGVWPFLDLVEKKNWKMKKIYFTQIGRPVPKHEEAQKELSERNKKAFLAYDGLNITF